MKFPSPYLPRSHSRWSLKWRQRVSRYYWNPWWSVKAFCEKWICLYGLLKFFDRIAFRWLMWSDFFERYLNSIGKGWKDL